MLIARQFSRAELEENVLRNTSGQDALKTILTYFKTHLEKKGYERSEIAIIKTDLLRRPKNKKGRETLPNVMVT